MQRLIVLNKPYRVLSASQDGMDKIILTESPYEGIIYTYGKVELVPDYEADNLTIRFEYTIIDNNDVDIAESEFRGYIGFILEDMLLEGIAENTLTYIGGI